MPPITCPVCTTVSKNYPVKDLECVCPMCETKYTIIETNGILIANLHKKFKSIPTIYVDLDGTLAKYSGWKGIEVIGPPVEKMLQRVFLYLDQGYMVKIFTARANDPASIPYIQKWLQELGLVDLEVTNIKGYDMVKLYDDRAVNVTPNEGPETLW